MAPCNPETVLTNGCMLAIGQHPQIQVQLKPYPPPDVRDGQLANSNQSKLSSSPNLQLACHSGCQSVSQSLLAGRHL
jgi:hypothetical protein